MCLRQGLQTSEGEESILLGVIKKVLTEDIVTSIGTKSTSSISLSEEKVF